MLLAYIINTEEEQVCIFDGLTDIQVYKYIAYRISGSLRESGRCSAVIADLEANYKLFEQLFIEMATLSTLNHIQYYKGSLLRITTTRNR